MIFDLAARDVPSPECVFDVCVVGAGAAGILLATDLVRRGRRVVLLEAGGRRHERSASRLTQGEVVGLPHKGVNDGRFRVLGGTTTEWGGQILELDEIDFGERPWIPRSGWPLSKAELRPYYDKVIDYLRLRQAFLDDEDVWNALGMQPPDFGGDLISAFSRWCPERNFARLEKEFVSNRQDLHVYLHANAVNLSPSENRRRVQSVECRSLNGHEAQFRAGIFVLALGGIESSRFLLQIGEERGWIGANSLIGTCFTDHITCSAARVVGNGSVDYRALFDYSSVGNYKYHPKMKLSAATQERWRTLNVAGTMVFSSKIERRAEQAADLVAAIRRRRPIRFDLGGVAAIAAQLPERVLGRLGIRSPTRSNDGTMTLRVHCEQAPSNGSRVTLSDRRDALGQFQPRLDWTTTTLELETIRRFVSVAKKAFERKGLGMLEPHPELFELDARFIKHFEDSSHHMGGTRMATVASEGVVDPSLRIHGTENAYICSSSVFPTSGFSNPTHTLLALAFRLSEHLSNAVLDRTALQPPPQRRTLGQGAGV